MLNRTSSNFGGYTVYGKGEKYMVNQKKSYSIALVSTAMVLMLANTTGAAPFAYITDLIEMSM